MNDRTGRLAVLPVCVRARRDRRRPTGGRPRRPDAADTAVPRNSLDLIPPAPHPWAWAVPAGRTSLRHWPAGERCGRH